MTITIPVAVATFLQASLIGAVICYGLCVILGLLAVHGYSPTPKFIPLGAFLIIGGTVSAVVTGLVTLVAMLFSTTLSEVVICTIIGGVVSASITSAFIWTRK